MVFSDLFLLSEFQTRLARINRESSRTVKYVSVSTAKVLSMARCWKSRARPGIASKYVIAVENRVERFIRAAVAAHGVSDSDDTIWLAAHRENS
jgi:hypothetical protein